MIDFIKYFTIVIIFSVLTIVGLNLVADSGNLVVDDFILATIFLVGGIVLLK